LKTKSEHTDFFVRVYNVVRKIPYGRVTTYGAIAKCIGSPQSARMVGWAMNASHTATPNVPAHRVVNRKGLLTGKQHFAGNYVMEDLLKSENIKIEDNKIIDFESVFWDPNIECF